MRELLYQPYVSSLRISGSSWSSQAETDVNMWDYGSPLKYNRQEEEQEMSLQAYGRFRNIFIITCSIGVSVSKKSTAPSIPST